MLSISFVFYYIKCEFILSKLFCCWIYWEFCFRMPYFLWFLLMRGLIFQLSYCTVVGHTWLAFQLLNDALLQICLFNLIFGVILMLYYFFLIGWGYCFRNLQLFSDQFGNCLFKYVRLWGSLIQNSCSCFIYLHCLMFLYLFMQRVELAFLKIRY